MSFLQPNRTFKRCVHTLTSLSLQHKAPPSTLLTLLEQSDPAYPLRQAQTFGRTHRLP